MSGNNLWYWSEIRCKHLSSTRTHSSCRSANSNQRESVSGSTVRWWRSLALRYSDGKTHLWQLQYWEWLIICNLCDVSGNVDLNTSFPLSRFLGDVESGEISFAVGGVNVTSSVSDFTSSLLHRWVFSRVDLCTNDYFIVLGYSLCQWEAVVHVAGN